MATQTPMMEVEVDLLPKQFDFCEAEEREVLYSGAFGAGKTRAVCYKTLLHALVPGNLVGLFRKTYAELRDTTLRTLLKPEGDLPPVLPEGQYEINKTDHLINVHGGGEIIYGGFDEPQRLASLNLGAAGVDEAIELDEDEYLMILGRLRNLADPCRQIFSATNPGPPSHFLHSRFFDEPDPARRLIQTNSLENEYLPDDYVESLKKFTGTNRQRYVLGLWAAFEGLVYQLRRDIHVVHRDGPWTRVMLGIDEGFSNPGVILVIGSDNDGRNHVIAEFYKAGVVPQEFVAEVGSLAAQYEASDIWADPSAAGLIADLRVARLHALSAKNDVLPGIRVVQDALVIAADDRPRLTIEPTCVNLVRELEGYLWKKGRDEPEKKNDHAPDALRYPLYSAATRVMAGVVRL